MSDQWVQQHVQKLAVSFEEADKDKSGALTLDEVVTVLTNNGFKGSAQDAKALFSKLDVNNDQKLTRDEFRAALNKLPRISVKEFVLRKAFKALDKDSNGTLTRAELEGACNKEMGVAISADRIQQLLTALDKDPKDEVIDYEEFLRVMGMQEAATVMSHVFRQLDKDNSGFLTKQELMAAVQGESELKLRAAKISDLLVAWHKDSDQKLDYNEFVQVWIKYK